MTFLFYVYEREDGKELGGQEGMMAPTILFEPQDLVISKLRSMVPNLPGCGQMGLPEILIGQTFKRNS